MFQRSDYDWRFLSWPYRTLVVTKVWDQSVLHFYRTSGNRTNWCSEGPQVEFWREKQPPACCSFFVCRHLFRFLLHYHTIIWQAIMSNTPNTSQINTSINSVTNVLWFWYHSCKHYMDVTIFSVNISVVSTLFWDFTQRRMVIPKLGFRTTYWLFGNFPKFQKCAYLIYFAEEAWNQFGNFFDTKQFKGRRPHCVPPSTAHIRMYNSYEGNMFATRNELLVPWGTCMCICWFAHREQ